MRNAKQKVLLLVPYTALSSKSVQNLENGLLSLKYVLKRTTFKSTGFFKLNG